MTDHVNCQREASLAHWSSLKLLIVQQARACVLCSRGPVALSGYMSLAVTGRGTPLLDTDRTHEL